MVHEALSDGTKVLSIVIDVVHSFNRHDRYHTRILFTCSSMDFIALTGLCVALRGSGRFKGTVITKSNLVDCSVPSAC